MAMAELNYNSDLKANWVQQNVREGERENTGFQTMNWMNEE